MEVIGQVHNLVALPLGKYPIGIHWIGGWVSARAGVDVVAERKILPSQELNAKLD
jgi:hypothetical protein